MLGVKLPLTLLHRGVDIINRAWAVWVKNGFLGLGGAGSASGHSIFYPSYDFTATYQAADTIRLAGLPGNFVPNREDIVAVIRFPLAGTAVEYTPDTSQFFYVAPDLTVAGAAFLPTDRFVVLIRGEAKALGREGSAPSGTYRGMIAGQDPTSLSVNTPWVDDAKRVHVVIEAGSTPILSTWTCTAAENVGDSVYNLAGVARRTNAGAQATMPSIGMILSKPDATHAVVVSAGDLAGVLAGLVPGAWYYADIVNGGITTTVPTLGGGFAVLQALGYSKSATEFVVDRQLQVVL